MAMWFHVSRSQGNEASSVLTTSFSMNRRACPGSDCGVPVASCEGLLSPETLVAMTRTVYSVPFVSSVITYSTLVVDAEDSHGTVYHLGSTHTWRAASYSSSPDFHCTLYPVVAAKSDEDQRTSSI